MLTLIGVFLGGYLIGSVPFAFLLVKRSSKIDIRQAGSGNVGGFNTFLVTRSKTLGILVGVLDGMKGLGAVLLAGYFVGPLLSIQAFSLFGAIVGHNYPLWLKFKGGRGLATAAGGLFVFGLSYTIVWCTVWAIAKRFGRDILTSNLIAIFITPLILAILPWEWVAAVLPARTDDAQFLLVAILLSLVLLARHDDILHDIWKGAAGETTNDDHSLEKKR